MYIILKGVVYMETLNDARIIAGVGIAEIADSLGVSYISLAKIFKEEESCPEKIKEHIKFFLISNYTKCIEKL